MVLLEDVEKMWSQDANINKLDLSSAASDIPKLHNKYYTLYAKEGMRLVKLRTDMKELTLAKTTYFNGTMDEYELRDRGWPPNQLKILRQDIPAYLEADKDIIELTLKIGYCNQIVKFLEDIIKQINSRNFIIKSMIDWARFQSGSL